MGDFSKEESTQNRWLLMGDLRMVFIADKK